METITQPYLGLNETRVQSWTQSMILERTLDDNIWQQAPRIIPSHSCLYDHDDDEEEETSENYGLEYLPTVISGVPIGITTDWATKTCFDPQKYYYLKVAGIGNRLYQCLSLVIYRDIKNTKN
jgi:hypothetical protein